MAVVWEPDLTLHPGASPGAYEADTGALRASLAGWRKGTPTMVVHHPKGARISWQATRLAWRMQDGSRVPFVVPGEVTEDKPEKNKLRVGGGMGGGVDDEYVVEGGRLKHTWILPALTVPEGAVSLLIEGRAFPFGCAFPSTDGRTAGSIGLYDEAGGKPFAFVRGEAEDESGNRTHTAYEWDTTGPAKKITLTVAVDAEWLRVADGRVRVDPTVATSTTATATYGPNQRKNDRFTNGTQLAAFLDGTTLAFRASRDAFLTSQTPTSATVASAGSASFHIDESNYIHLAIRFEQSTPDVRYMRGTPTFDASFNLTSIAWSTATIVAAPGTGTIVDLIAHAEGTGWKVHITFSSWDSVAATVQTWYRRLNITSTGTITFDGSSATSLEGAVSSADHSYPAVTLDASKNVFVVWRRGSANLTARVAKITYPAWTPGSAETVVSSLARSPLCTHVDTQGRLVVSFHDASNVRVFRRAAAGGWSDISPAATAGTNPVIVGDDTDNYYLFYTSSGLRYRKYDAATGVWGAEVVADSTASAAYPTIRRTTTGNAADVLYQVGVASPYTVKFFHHVLNSPPQEPIITITPGVFAAATGTTITGTHKDGDQMSGWALYRQNGSIKEWWDNALMTFAWAGEYINLGTGYTFTLPAADNAGDWTTGKAYQLYSATRDSVGVMGPYSSTAVMANVGAVPTVTITSPGTTNSGTYTAEITADMPISATQWRVLDGAAVVSDTGKVAGTSLTRTVDTPTNGKVYTVEATAWDTTSGGGIASTPATKAVTTSFTPPPAPIPTVASIGAGGHIAVSWGNPAGATAVGYNDLLRRLPGGVLERIATGLPSNGSYQDFAVASAQVYDYIVRAVGTNQATTDSAAVSASVTLTGVWLHDVLDPAGTALHLPINTGRAPSWTPDVTLARYAGRSRPVAIFAEGADDRAHYDLTLLNGEGSTLRALAQRRATLCARDSSGRKLFGIIPAFNPNETPGLQTVPLDVVATDYQEVV